MSTAVNRRQTGSNVNGVGYGKVIIFAGPAVYFNVPEGDGDGALRPLPERLVMELTARRILALREAVARSPKVALTLPLLKLVNDTFRTSSSAGSCFKASVRHVYMSALAIELKDSVVVKLVHDRQAEWKADLPLREDATLWDYLAPLDQASGLPLLAHCFSYGMTALHAKVNSYALGIAASVWPGRRYRLARLLRKSFSTQTNLLGAGGRQLPEPHSQGSNHRGRARGNKGSESKNPRSH